MIITVKVDRNSSTEAMWNAADHLGLEVVAAVGGGVSSHECNGLRGNTFQHRDKLKSAGFKWNSSAKLWMSGDDACYAALMS